MIALRVYVPDSRGVSHVHQVGVSERQYRIAVWERKKLIMALSYGLVVVVFVVNVQSLISASPRGVEYSHV